MEEPLIGPRFSRNLDPYHVLLAVDIEHFCSRPNQQLPELSSSVPRILEEAMRRSGLDWSERRFPQGFGDGFVLGLPPERAPHLLDPFLRHLHSVLAEERNHLRMRVSIHLGTLPDSGGQQPADGVGKAMNDVHRLLDCEPLRDALAQTDPESTLLIAIISDRVLTDVVEAGYSALTRGQLAPVRAQVKEFSENAWLYVPVPSGNLLLDGIGRPDRTATAGSEAGKGIKNRVGESQSIGTVLQSGSITGSTIVTTTSNRGRVVDLYPIPTAELDSAQEFYVAPPGMERAREILRSRHLVVLVGDPGGRRTTACNLLGELAQETGISVLDVGKRWERPSVSPLPLHTGCGYLLNLNDPAMDSPDEAFTEDLGVHAARLVDRGSYLVVIVRPELWQDGGSAAGLTVDLGLPDPNTVLATHLKRLGAESSAGLFPTLRYGVPPRDVVDMAARAVKLPPEPVPDSMDRIHLVIIDPEGVESVFPLHDGLRRRSPVTLGRRADRNPPPDVALGSDPASGIGRKQGVLEYQDGGWWFRPTGKNHTRILRRGEPEQQNITERLRLRDGDVLRMPGKPDRKWRVQFRDPHETRSANDRMSDENASEGDNQ